MGRAPIQAAGGVVWRTGPNSNNGAQIEVALVHRPRYDDWSLPKGKLAHEESELEGAVREVLEETGHRVQTGRFLGVIRYLKESGGGSREKVVHYWAMRAIGGAFTPGAEVDELRWLKLDDARELVTRATDIEVLERFAMRPAMTGSVLLVRHASAGNRSDWTGDDRDRPLDSLGEDQAEELVRLLSRFGVEDIVSADNARCVDTVRPLSESLGVPIRTDTALSEDGFPGSEEHAVALIRDLGRPGGGAVACSQGDVIPELVARLAAEDGVEVEEPLRIKKAGVWALSFDDHRLCAADRFRPPKI
jgi:8-oxo-dGTP diphosphatase